MNTIENNERFALSDLDLIDAIIGKFTKAVKDLFQEALGDDYNTLTQLTHNNEFTSGSFDDNSIEELAIKTLRNYVEGDKEGDGLGNNITLRVLSGSLEPKQETLRNIFQRLAAKSKKTSQPLYNYRYEKDGIRINFGQSFEKHRLRNYNIIFVLTLAEPKVRTKGTTLQITDTLK